MNIKEILSAETLSIRNAVLRPGMNISACVFEGDDLSSTKHFGAFSEENDLVGIVSIFYKDHDAIETKNVFQIRGMASSKSYRGHGVGRLLLSAVESYAKKQGAILIWANARTSAIGFYTKLGYSLASEEFHIKGVGSHNLVTKLLI
jgi:GNAT superfamily N-acetyltransferase